MKWFIKDGDLIVDTYEGKYIDALEAAVERSGFQVVDERDEEELHL